MRITLGIPTNRGIRPKTAQSLLDMVSHSKQVDFHVCVAERGYTISENRNYMVVQAMRNKSDYILMVDDDMTFPADTLQRLILHDKEVIGVNSYSRCLPLSSTVGLMDKKGEYMHPDKHTEWEMQIPDGLFKAFFVGAGVLLIKMSVFDKLKKPYFHFTTDKNGQIIHGEDGYFCSQVKKAGMDIWCDSSLEIFHLGEYAYGKPQEKFNTFVPSEEEPRDAMVASVPPRSAVTKML